MSYKSSCFIGFLNHWSNENSQIFSLCDCTNDWSFFAAFTVWVVYLDAINKESDQNKTAGIFATYPNPNLSTFGGFFDQFIATSLLIIVVLAITDKKNNEIQNGTSNIIVGLTVTIIGTAFGYNCGYAINPARDLGLL